MKNSILKSLLLFVFSFYALNHALSANIIFKATVKTTENAAIPRVYIKFYVPGQSVAVDSMFTDNSGYIERELSFLNQTGIPHYKAGTSVIVKKLSPNIIAGDEPDCFLDYNHAGKPELYFVDICGRTYPNKSILPVGLYFYYLRFDNGDQSEINRMVVAVQSVVKVRIISTAEQTNVKLKSGTETPADVDKFYAVIIKDGYVTRQDTILIGGGAINKTYQLLTAEKPTAGFTFSGTLKAGEPVVFDASTSAGAKGENLVYSWDFGNGKKGQSGIIPHIYNAAGNYTVALTVAGNYGATHTISKTITINSGVTPPEYTGVVKGYITDANENDLANVTASLIEGSAQAVSDNTGLVTLSGLPTGIPIHLKITKTGYANQVVGLTIPEDTKQGLFFTTLKSRSAAITFSRAEFGGEIVGGDGTSMTLPVDGLIKPDGTVATGNVSVSITPVNVAIDAASFPGTFNGLRSNGSNSVLLSLGVSEFNFQQGSSQLQLAAGKTAVILIPIYTSGATIGDQIPLWSINEDNGTWVEEGSGTVVASNNSPTGLAMKASIGHLSWWNCDIGDNPRNLTNICYRLECSSAICVREVVPCWWSGAFRDETGSASISSMKAKRISSEQADAVPPVFQVREFIPESGKNLFYPSTADVYLQARTFNDQGELLIGNYILRASEDIDTIKIQMFSMYTSGDTINLPIDSTMSKYLKKDEILYFRVAIPAEKLYKILAEQGSSPRLSSGVYRARNEQEMIVSGDIDGIHKYFYTGSGEIIITVSKTDENSEGNFKRGVYDPRPVLLAPNDSITDSLTVSKKIKLHSLKSTKNTLCNIRFYKQANSHANYIKLISPSGKFLVNEDLNTTEGLISTYLTKDSAYYLEVSGYPCKYTLITHEESISGISYGDTITNRLKYIKDKDMYTFTGHKDDMISVKGLLPVSGLYGGLFNLINTNGSIIAEKTMKEAQEKTNDHEIIYKLPADGSYYIVVSSSANDSGTYRIILNKITMLKLSFDSGTVLDVIPQKEYYCEFEVPAKKYVHVSIIGDKGNGGIFNLYTASSAKLNAYNNYSHYYDYFSASFADYFEGGTYYLKLENGEDTKLYINILEPKSLNFDNKGKVQFNDTIRQLYKFNAYRITNPPSTGIHAKIKSILGTSAPQKLALKYLPLSKKGEPVDMTIYNYSSTYPDSTIIHESCGNLMKSDVDTVWVLLVYATSTGNYEFTFYRVKENSLIKVDDDFAEYPDAQTSSLVAAGYAVPNNGELMVANGTYSSCIPIRINATNVRFTGQQKENVFLENANRSASVVDFSNKGGIMKDLTVRTSGNYSAVLLSGSNITVQNVDIKARKGEVILTGLSTLSYSSYLTLKNISITGAATGMDVETTYGVIENCVLNTTYSGIECYGSNNRIRHDSITVNNAYRAILSEPAANFGNGFCNVDSNAITINTISSSNDGCISIKADGGTNDTSTVYIRHNNIKSAGSGFAISATNGRGPSKIVIENNSYTSTDTRGGKALNLGNSNVYIASSIIVRNNIFDGLGSQQSIKIYGVDLISQDQRFALYNNSFRMAANAYTDTSGYFIWIQGKSLTFEDTANVYLVNNIFTANNHSYLVACYSNITFYSDYNDVYNFRKYLGKGTIIGRTHDITSNPLYIDNLLHVDTFSPSIDIGASPALFKYIPVFDITGKTRPQGIGYDMGAYETK